MVGMNVILHIIHPELDVLESYMYTFDMIIRVARLTGAELACIDAHLYRIFESDKTSSMNTVYMYFQEACVDSQVRPLQYWLYLFSQ